MSNQQSQTILGITAPIVAAHVGSNHVDASAIPSLIQSVYRALAGVDVLEPEPVITLQPAVPVKKSVFPDFIVCLEDGKKLKMHKRHLRMSYGMTPADYRTKWGLPRDYAMVAANYAATRPRLAKKIGLGRKASVKMDEPAIAQAEEPNTTIVKAKRARI